MAKVVVTCRPVSFIERTLASIVVIRPAIETTLAKVVVMCRPVSFIERTLASIVVIRPAIETTLAKGVVMRRHISPVETALTNVGRHTVKMVFTRRPIIFFETTLVKMVVRRHASFYQLHVYCNRVGQGGRTKQITRRTY